ncbi:MAG TPA: prolipoprotein diacylglyceryl transferase family protein, partial [Polyangiaceae bacterium]|nr:prolipoprotein diacylglyceryl transferase family protein [Polyangiaceae bacterium]
MISAPLIPYFHLPDILLVPAGLFGARFPSEAISIKPFGALVATGIYLGAFLAIRQGKRLGMDERALVSLIFWAVGMAFVGAHVLDLVFYYPDKLIEDPLSLLRMW